MLCQFTFKNFKSYRDETIFDMQAANIEEFSNSLIPPLCKGFSPLLPVSVIYGPNAGGKTNALDALSYVISRILMPICTSTDYNHPVGMLLTRYTPFLFDESSKENPSEFEIYFRTNSAQYQYKLSIINNTVLSESLYYVKMPCQRRRSVLLFERTGNTFTLGAALKKANTQQVSASIPYLSFLAINFDFPEIADAISWFKNSCIISYAVSGKDHRISPIIDNPSIKPAVLSMLSGMDIPLSDYEIKEEDSGDGETNIEVITMHTVGEKTYPLELRNESEGTVKILSALPAVILSLANGGLLVVDELDAKLHPQLLRFLVKMYTDPDINQNHAQLVFSCHDLSIMKNDMLRRDEIWFAARNKDEVSDLWSLYDLQDEKGERIKTTAAYDRQYLAGRYGADPYLKQLLNWRIHDGKEVETT